MRTSVQTIVRHMVSLDKSEEFTIKPPRGWRNWTVRLIEVNEGAFFLYGGPGKNKRDACVQLHHGFRSVEEVPTMPAYIARAVERSLESLKQ